jgi:hypothetical protein
MLFAGKMPPHAGVCASECASFPGFFSRNRLNVAISRAQCLAYLVCSPRLLDANCQTVEQMRLANALCLLVEHAETV